MTSLCFDKALELLVLKKHNPKLFFLKLSQKINLAKFLEKGFFTEALSDPLFSKKRGPLKVLSFFSPIPLFWENNVFPRNIIYL